ncbi:MAG: polynucleotide adenylyltransferase PcnB [Deltaproteobacteria bacterium]|jgi:poly(A) polymerase|nr:polynucleotide adenylyltransferase PcnB [Deltaproteobacteria bacterium]MBW2520228.1 polynucleotide adenylyltransferase PcnB [Deltaproteobacteria bacterium]
MPEPNHNIKDDAEPVILPRSEHGISRKQIDAQALKVLYRLHRQGYQAYLVGGCVRDLLLGRTPKDFDVGTNATPQEVKKLFRNCFLVGRRFRLAHIRFGNNQVVEVATFRRQPGPEELPEDRGEHAFFVQNLFGTPREDAFRRDFTVNALFYNIANFEVIDHVGGLADLKARRLRVIGDPLLRFTEDPVRMLRALEFNVRLGFSLDEEAREAIYARAPLMADAAPARIREEILGLFRNGVGSAVLRRAQAMGLIGPMMAGYESDEATFALLEILDQKALANDQIDEAEIIASLFLNRFWRNCPVSAELPISEVLQMASLLLTAYCSYYRISHGLRHQAKELLVGCYRMARGLGRRGERRLLRHPMTPRVLELYRAWLKANGESMTLAMCWQQALDQQRQSGKEANASQKTQQPRRRPRSRRRRPPRTAKPS